MMEKISIVRRRLEVSPTQAELRARQRAQSRAASFSGGSTALALLPEPSEDMYFGEMMGPAKAPGDGAARAYDSREPAGGAATGSGNGGHPPGDAMTVDLSQDAKDELWSSGHLDETASGTRHFIVEAARDRQDGRVVLKLEFMKPDYYLRLLTAEEVCEMLHVSRSSLYQYARAGQLRTYRMGRGLRFRFQDVLDFITGCQIRKA